MPSTCSTCGKKFPDSATTCNWCKPQTTEHIKSESICSICGVQLPEGDSLCPNCSVPENTEQAQDRSQTGSIGSLIGGSLAVLLALLTWRIISAFTRGGPFAHPDSLDMAVFWGPIVLAIAPRMFEDYSVVTKLWAIAIAPIVGALNFFPCLFFYRLADGMLGQTSQQPQFIGTVLSVAIWLPVSFLLRKSSSPYKKSGSNGDTPCKPPGG